MTMMITMMTMFYNDEDVFHLYNIITCGSIIILIMVMTMIVMSVIGIMTILMVMMMMIGSIVMMIVKMMGSIVMMIVH